MDIDFLSPALVADPFPVYEEVRRTGRCVPNEGAGIWMVPGHQDAVAVLRDVDHYSSTIMGDETFGPWYDGAPTMLGVDPPEHTRLRSAVQGLFTNRATARREPRVRQIVRDLLDAPPVADRLAAGQPVDLVGALAEPLSSTVVCELIGVPATERTLVASWTQEMVLGSVAAVAAPRQPGAAEVYERAVAAGRSLADYLTDQVRWRRTHRKDDLIAHLLHAERTGAMTEREVVAMCVLLLLAGIEATAKLIGNALVLLSDHPDERRRLAEDPRRIPSGVEEVLRFAGPTQFDPRLVVGAVDLGGTQLADGDVVWLLTAAAGRDPERFPAPGRFDVARPPGQHLAFGHGPHLCLGAPLARLEAKAALGELLSRVPDFTVTDVDHGTGFFVRGPESLAFRAA